MSTSLTRARVFIDFWNFTLSIKEHKDRYKLDWNKLSPFLISETSSLIRAPLQFEETRVYLSYDPRTAVGKRLRRWAFNTLDRFPGVRVVAKERKPKRPPRCPICHKLVATCPHCSGSMKGTIEKGIDAAIITDMISLAWQGAWDVAILATSDRDYIPMIELLMDKGLRVVNAYFPPKGMHLARTCWGNIDLLPHLGALAR